jgi:uncharacterized protein
VIKMRTAGKFTFARISLCLLSFFVAIIVAAQVTIPPLVSRITDITNTLTAEQKKDLEQKLSDFEKSKGSQIGVLLIQTTQPEAIEQYALRVVDQWKLGRKKIDDGALLIIAKDDRVMRIEVGYGLEGVLNDATSKRIISEVITPKFKQADFYGGIDDGIERMMQVINGEALPAPPSGSNKNKEGIDSYIPAIFVLAMVVGSVLRAIFGRVPGAVVTGGVMGFLVWLFAGVMSIALFSAALAFIFTLLGGGKIGRFIAGQGGNGFGGGGFGGGGGFSGGGGGFGGGGASGKW